METSFAKLNVSHGPEAPDSPGKQVETEVRLRQEYHHLPWSQGRNKAAPSHSKDLVGFFNVHVQLNFQMFNQPILIRNKHELDHMTILLK